jgi:curved DNA-binding protein CbpA
MAATYKRLARTHHPDKMAGEPQEVKEFAEQRMKQTNAAYSELKQRGSHA